MAKKAKGGIPEDKKERDKLISSLLRLGFSTSKIINMMKSFDGEL